MIEASVVNEDIVDKDELRYLLDLDTRVDLLVDYINKCEEETAKDILKYEGKYYTPVSHVSIKTEKVLWFLGRGHLNSVLEMFAEGEQFSIKLEKKEAEAAEQESGEQNA